MASFTTRDACALRLVSRLCCADVAAARWLDAETRITGSLAAWRACFPGARAANVMVREDLKDADFAHLTGVKKVNRAVAAAGLRVDPGRTWTDGRGGRR